LQVTAVLKLDEARFLQLLRDGELVIRKQEVFGGFITAREIQEAIPLAVPIADPVAVEIPEEAASIIPEENILRDPEVQVLRGDNLLRWFEGRFGWLAWFNRFGM
jgi:hypothetical protein